MASKFQITVERAIELFGTPLALAEALGIERSNVYMWESGKPIPDKHALRIRYELKPEAFKKNGAKK